MSPSFRRATSVALLVVLGTINFADKAALGLAAGPITADLHLSPAQWGIVGSGFYLLFSLGSLLGGAWSDRIGPKPLLAFLNGIWAVLQLAMIWTVGFSFLLISRILLGAAEGPFYGTVAHALGKWLPAERQGTGMALVTLGSAAGPALLAPVLSLLILAVGWRASFGVLGVVSLLWLLGWWVLREPRPASDAIPPPATSVPLKELLAVFFTARILLITLAGLAAYCYLSLLVVWVPSYLQQARHLAAGSPLYLLGIFLPWACGGTLQIVLALISDRLFQRYGNRIRVLFLVGSLVVGAGLLLLVAFVPLTPLAIMAMALMPVGVIFPLIATLLTDLAPSARQGTIQGLSVAMYSLGGLLAPGIVGMVIQRFGPVQGFTWAWAGLALLLLLTGMLILVGVRMPASSRHKRRPASRLAPRTIQQLSKAPHS